jgi:hypothetical protein
MQSGAVPAAVAGVPGPWGGRSYRLLRRRRRLQCLDLLFQILVFLDELREALFDLVNELVNLQHLIARLAGHPEPLVADVVERQRHRAPRYLGGTLG